MGTPEGGKPGVTVPMYSDWRRGTSGGSASMCSVTSSLSAGQGPALQADVPSLSLNVGISCGFIEQYCVVCVGRWRPWQANGGRLLTAQCHKYLPWPDYLP
ncbi:unnamed protein product [Polarella glacialis]|uniref:Uncharacterized protein n=1 Tax=Polarella glacialis TaxID=89957 RepID=A0A813LCX3_POLGL|nr:unnamed protein product [Polarella glacialis]